jgi:hypothetical protein
VDAGRTISCYNLNWQDPSRPPRLPQHNEDEERIEACEQGSVNSENKWDQQGADEQH